MSAEKERLHQAILDDPDDGAVRLVYADWLEENGRTDEERDLAEFIRVQSRLAGLEEWDDDHVELDIRARELHALHRQEWQRPVRPFWDSATPYQAEDFRQGFPGVVRLPPERFLKHHEALFQAAPVREARLWHTDPIPAALWACPGLRRVRKLKCSFSRSPGQALFLPALADCEHLSGLRELALENYAIGRGEVDALFGSRRLRAIEGLHLGNCELHPRAFPLLASRPPSGPLRELTLDDATPEGMRGLVRSEWFGRLNAFRLYKGGRIPSDPRDGVVEALVNHRHARGLRSLHLKRCNVQGRALAALAGSKHLTGLVELELSQNYDLGRPNRDGLLALAASANLSSLKALRLAYCALRPMSAKALLASPRLGRLRCLALSCGYVSDRCLKTLVESGLPGTLRVLELPGNEIGPKGLRYLAEGPAWPHLRRLSLYGNDSDVGSVRAILDGPKFPRLIALTIDSCREGGDELARMVAGCPGSARFRELILMDEVSDEGAAALADSKYLDGLGLLRFWAHRMTDKGRRLRRRFGGRVQPCR
jgi:uncharacterized protein (TIGR02996 family)